MNLRNFLRSGEQSSPRQSLPKEEVVSGPRCSGPPELAIAPLPPGGRRAPPCTPSSIQSFGAPTPEAQGFQIGTRVFLSGVCLALLFPGKFSRMRLVFGVEQIEPMNWTLVGLPSCWGWLSVGDIYVM